MSSLLVAALILFHVPAPSLAQDESALDRAAQEAPDFATEVRPILARRCFACHGNDEETREAGLRLDSFEAATLDRDGFPAVVPGSSEDSEVMARITDEFDPMPPESTGDSLSPEEVDILRRWMDSGGGYAPHWAFVAPERREVVEDASVHPVDALIAQQHAARGLSWSPPADDFTLLRRLSLDLTGLPPTPEAARAYAASTDPGKYEAAIEDLLASPAYAERWAAVWLDLARYADSSGHGSDPLREIWRYRDWVIEAFDANMPFDEFTVKQLAGDLLPDATVEDRLATAFHRNTMTNTEGGTDDEEFRVLAVKDRVNTTMSVWMGLTAGCAECHSHKYDPISHVEYYQLFDIFNQTEDTDRNDDRPRLRTPTAEQQLASQVIEAEVEEAEVRMSAYLSDASEDELVAKEAELLERFHRQDWTGARFDAAPTGLEGATLSDDGVVINAPTAGVARQTATWTRADGPVPTALRLDVLSHASLPRGGPGLAPGNGNFVLTDLRLRAVRLDARPVTASRVRIELPGGDRILSLAEVQLIGPDGEVLDGALQGATQSTTGFGGSAARAIDGRTDGTYNAESVTHTETGMDPWWEAELVAPSGVYGVRVWPRTDGTLESRSQGFRVVLLGADGSAVWTSAPAPAPAGDGGSSAAGGDLLPEVPFLDVGPVVGEPLRMMALSASHEQEGFEASRAVDGLYQSEDGWAVGGGQGSDQSAIFALPDLAPGAYRWTLTLAQEFEGHLLGRWRLAMGSSGGSKGGSLIEAPLLFSDALVTALETPRAQRETGQVQAVEEALLMHDGELLAMAKQRDDARARLAAIGAPTTPVMVELPAAMHRTSHVLSRGNFLQPAEEVQAAVPAVFPPLPDGVEPDRLALAKWLMSETNPLTARVTVNRVWSRLFGRGLVLSEGDFGSQAELPSHPELLDWLAVDFRTGGWDHKALLQTIVTSRTYQQSSDLRAESAAADPEGLWLSRYPRQRLEAEVVRDAILEAAGLLSSKRFGPSVFPPQPEGLWKAAFNGQRNWKESTGEDRYRRGLYVFLRRTIPYPMLATFDAPSRETCTVQRIPTNTPLQAFVTLNDPVFVEASRALVNRAVATSRASSGDLPDTASPRDVIRRMLWCCLSCPPVEAQVEVLASLYADALEAFSGDPSAAAEFGGAASDGSLTAAERAAWTLVASTALNLDRALTKE